MSPSTSSATHFETLQSFQAEYAPTKITQYRSKRTGMSVVVVDRAGPKVSGYFTLATEIFDDSGAPHTLEHLCFMGSKMYPYKGVLDKLANRAYSNTNAWTATDHTAYTMDTAGWEGFAQILPVYLDHLIQPRLTDEGCHTEVHHINGDGEDAGVVYSEMQGVQNNGQELMDLAARRLLYPETVGFRYETGGMMQELRKLTADRIRAFHKEMYQPKNLCLVVVGEVDHENLLEILETFEGSIVDTVPKISDPFRRPWIESPPTPDLKESVTVTCEFPEEDESSGDILVAFFGPDCNDVVQSSALTILLTYLTGSSISVLENKLVEQEHLASSVTSWVDSRSKSVIWFQPTSVAVEKMADVEKRMFEILKEVAENPLDMDYMRDVVRRERRQVKYQAEASPDFFCSNIINDFLYGTRDAKNPSILDLSTIKEYDELEQWTEEQWRAFLKKWILDAPHVTVLGKPSKAMAEKLKADEIARVAAQKEALGPEGLAQKKKELEEATAKNDAPIPTEILEQWPVPGVSSIHFIKPEPARAGLARKLGTSENVAQKTIDGQKDTPLFVMYEHVPTNFVTVSVLLGTSCIPLELLPMLPLFIDNFFNTPVMMDGNLIPFEMVVGGLEQDTIAYSIGGGSRLGDSEGVVIQFSVEPEKYEKTITAIKTFMFDSVFDVTRLNAALSKLLADIPEAKRDGNSMAYGVDAMVHLDSRSALKARSTLVKGTYMKRIKKILARDPDLVIAKLEALRKAIFTFENMRCLVIADVEKLPNATGAWDQLVQKLEVKDEILPIVKTHQRLSEAGKNAGSLGAVVVPMGTLDSSYLIASVNGPTSYDDPVIPAGLVAVAYIEAVEGPLWRAVRGTGLAYGTSYSRDIESGSLQYKIYRSPDAHKAFKASKQIVEDIASGKVPFEKSALEGARSAIVVSIADDQPTMNTAAQLSFINTVVRGVDSDYYPKLLEKVQTVSEGEIRAAMQNWLLKVFEAGKADVVITCANVMEEGLKKNFEADGFKTAVKALSDFKDDYGLKAVEGDEETEESEDEEGSESGSDSGSNSGDDHKH